MDRDVREIRDIDENERDSGWLWPAVILALVLIGVLVFATSEDDTYTRARLGGESESAQDLDATDDLDEPSSPTVNSEVNINPPPSDRGAQPGSQGSVMQERPDSASGPSPGSQP